MQYTIPGSMPELAGVGGKGQLDLFLRTPLPPSEQCGP